MNAKSIRKNSRNKPNITKLRQKDDSNINYEDSPATTKEFWKDADVFMPQPNVVLKAHVNSHPHRK